MRKINAKKLTGMLYFAVVLLVSAILLQWFMNSGYEMTAEKRMTAEHTVFFLNILNIESKSYELVIRINETDDYLENISEIIGNNSYEEERFIGYYEYRLENVDNVLVESIKQEQQKGKRIVFSTATVMINENEIDIISECTAFTGIITVLALIIGYPRRNFRKKVYGSLIAVPLMYLVNILRISTTAITGHYYGFSTMNIVHSFLWKFLLVFSALIIWFLWIKLFKIDRE